MKKLFLIPILFFLTVLTGCETDYVGIQIRHVTSYEFGIIKSQAKPEDDPHAQILYTVELFNPFSGQPIHDSITGKPMTRKWLKREWISVNDASIDQMIRQSEKVQALRKKYEE